MTKLRVAMDPVSKSALQARILEYFRQVEQTGEELIVLDDNDRPILKVVPIRQRRPASDVFGAARGKVVYREDLLAPTTAEWPET